MKYKNSELCIVFFTWILGFCENNLSFFNEKNYVWFQSSYK